MSILGLGGIEAESGDSEAAVVRRARSGDGASYDVLVKIHYDGVVHLVKRYVRDPHESADVAQEVFLRAYLALPGFRSESGFFTWLFAIAVNAAKSHLRAKSREPSAGALDLEEIDGAGQPEWADWDSPEQLLLQDELRKGILRAVERLPRELRAAFILLDLELLSYQEIAGLLRCPIGTVRSRIFRARAAIKAEITACDASLSARQMQGEPASRRRSHGLTARLASCPRPAR